MEDQYCYYIFKNVYMGEKVKLPFNTRIWKNKTSNSLIYGVENCDGPYDSLEKLERFSSIIQELREKYGPTAYKVLFQEQNISIFSEIVLIPKDKQYSLDFVTMLSHGTQGDINRYTSTGGHLLDSRRVRITALIGKNAKGVIKANIEIFDYKKQIWIPKKVPSTLFPIHWDLQKYSNECRYCLENHTQIYGEKYKATTTCGIETRLIIQNDKIVTFYPVF